MRAGRPFHVFDSHGDHLASFATFQTAHDWAHLQAAMGGTATPIEVADRTRRVTWRLTSQVCEFVAWEAITHLPLECSTIAAESAADSASGDGGLLRNDTRRHTPYAPLQRTASSVRTDPQR